MNYFYVKLLKIYLNRTYLRHTTCMIWCNLIILKCIYLRIYIHFCICPGMNLSEIKTPVLFTKPIYSKELLSCNSVTRFRTRFPNENFSLFRISHWPRCSFAELLQIQIYFSSRLHFFHHRYGTKTLLKYLSMFRKAILQSYWLKGIPVLRVTNKIPQVTYIAHGLYWILLIFSLAENI